MRRKFSFTGNMNAAEVVYNIAKARGYPGPRRLWLRSLLLYLPAMRQSSPLWIRARNKLHRSAKPMVRPCRNSAPEAIIKMSDADFEKWATEGNWRKLMGG